MTSSSKTKRSSRPSPKSVDAVIRELTALGSAFPRLVGKPIRVSFRPALRAKKGKLLSRSDKGSAVHAGSLLVGRRMVFDTELLDERREFARIFLHELFHFVWRRLGNPARWSYEGLLTTELASRARGELGWSAEERKRNLRAEDITGRSVRWREYACESFCDTAAWLYGRWKSHPEFTLGARWRKWRRDWFKTIIDNRELAV